VDQQMKDHDRLDSLERETETHIVQCEERWKSNFRRLDHIDETLKRIESRTITIGGAAILFLASLVITVLSGKMG